MKQRLIISIMASIVCIGLKAQPNDTLYGIEPIPDSLTTDTVPSYAWGGFGLSQFISTHYKYPASALEEGIEGTIIVEFIVNKEGVLENPQVVQKLCPPCDEEALRIIKKLKNFIPATKDGVPVNSRMRVPIRLLLQ